MFASLLKDIESASRRGRCGRCGLRGCVFFEEVADFEVNVWEVGCAAEPVVVGIDVYRLSNLE